MTVQIQGFPARFAEAVNRLGAARFEHAGTSRPHGDAAVVTLADGTFVGRAAHGERVSRRGRRPWFRRTAA